MRKRTKRLRMFAMALAGMLVLSSCGSKEVQQKVEEATEKLPQLVSLEEIDLKSLDLSMGTWKDNSLDQYSATCNYELKRSYPEDAIMGGGTASFVGNTGAYHFKKHLFEEYEKCWDEIVYVDQEGNSVSNHIEIGEQVWTVGAIAGSDDCLVEKITLQEGSDYIEHHVMVVDKGMKLKQDIHLSFLDGEALVVLSEMMMDADGNLHFVSHEEGNHYIITDSAGEIINDYRLQEGWENLYLMADGRVAIKTEALIEDGTATRYTFQYYDSTSQSMVKLAEVNAEYNASILNMICPDESTVVFANKRGIFQGSPENIEGATCLYSWEKHGLFVSRVNDLQCPEEGRISLVCSEGEKEYYLNLRPTTEEVPVQMITFAVSGHKRSLYEKAVAAFNKKYPAYQIVLKSDYEQTALLTKLMAGDGPVLIDTTLTGFDTQKELWLSMDIILDKLELTDEVVLPAMELGRIDGQLYGVVDDFYIDTVVTVGDEPGNWNYETLTKEILENQKLEALTDNVSCPEAWTFMARFLLHELEDNYFIDRDTKTTNFKEPQTRELLEAIKKYYSTSKSYKMGELLEEGGVLCNQVYIMRPEQLALYRMYYGEKLQYSGYPTKDGGKHYLVGNQPITIRRNASKEEVIGACLFLQTLLSYEVQAEKIKNDMQNLSVRKDVLEEQLAAVNQDTNAYAMGIDQTRLGNSVDHAKDKETFYYLLENATPKKSLPRELLNIIADELCRYVDGEIDVDMALEHLENRVQLYLDEN